MTNEEKVFFEKLVKARLSHFNHVQEAERVGTVEGYWDSVVDKYSDQAHFIYEILQNADDALARNAHFELFGCVLTNVILPKSFYTIAPSFVAIPTRHGSFRARIV